MELSYKEKRWKFTQMLGLLLIYMDKAGYHAAIDDVKCRTGHMKGSLHYEGLAADINLYDSEGKWLPETEDHLIFGEFWESMGGSWGGRFKDGNHYSLAHNGKK